MNCNDVRHAIYVYIDDEFAPQDKLDFEAHLQSCPHCRAMAKAETEFVSDVRACIATPVAPEGLRERIETRLKQEPAPVGHSVSKESSSRSRPFWWVAVPAFVAACLTVVVVSQISQVKPEPIPVPEATENPVADSAIIHHQHDLPMEVRGSERQVREFLQDNVRFAVQLPFQTNPNIKLVGARLSQLNGRGAVLFYYDYSGKRLTVLQTADPNPASEVADSNVDVQQREGYKVMTYRRGGLTSSVVGDVKRSDIPHLIRASYRP